MQSLWISATALLLADLLNMSTRFRSPVRWSKEKSSLISCIAFCDGRLGVLRYYKFQTA